MKRSFEESNSSEVQEIELMLLPVQDLLVGTAMSTGTRGSTTGKMMMLTICFDLKIMKITETMMLTKNLTMTKILKFNVSGFQAENNDPAVNDTHTDHLITRRKIMLFLTYN